MSEMKVIMSAVVLAVAILMGAYFHAQTVRYELAMTENILLRIDRQTGVVWRVRPNADGSGRWWVQIAEEAE